MHYSISYRLLVAGPGSCFHPSTWRMRSHKPISINLSDGDPLSGLGEGQQLLSGAGLLASLLHPAARFEASRDAPEGPREPPQSKPTHKVWDLPNFR